MCSPPHSTPTPASEGRLSFPLRITDLQNKYIVFYVYIYEIDRSKPWYLEECSSTLAATYSSGTPGSDHGVTTVDMDTKMNPETICTSEHSGTRIQLYYNYAPVLKTQVGYTQGRPEDLFGSGQKQIVGPKIVLAYRMCPACLRVDKLDRGDWGGSSVISRTLKLTSFIRFFYILFICTSARHVFMYL